MANICRNSAIDKLRSKEISQSSKTNTIDDFVYGLEGGAQTQEKIDGIGVKELMDQLNTDQKFIIEYIYFQGYTHSEIAEEFDIPLGTVKSRLRAALQVLKKNIERI
jgi:RNA polymerase sigma-70 factor (ECF subfamily)